MAYKMVSGSKAKEVGKLLGLFEECSSVELIQYDDGSYKIVCNGKNFIQVHVTREISGTPHWPSDFQHCYVWSDIGVKMMVDYRQVVPILTSAQQWGMYGSYGPVVDGVDCYVPEKLPLKIIEAYNLLKISNH